MSCGSNLQLQLCFPETLETSNAVFGAGLWGVHHSTGCEQIKIAFRYVKHLKQLCGLPSDIPVGPRLAYSNRWLRSCIRCWNQLLALPADDL